MFPVALAADDVSADVNFSGSTFNLLTPALAMFSGVYLIFVLAIYVYMAWALMTIAQKTSTPNGWLAWIPIGNLYLMTQIAGVPWWTMLVIFVGFIPVLGSLAILAVTLWWWWKISEKCGKEGWWALLFLIPVVNLVIMGILAWGKK